MRGGILKCSCLLALGWAAAVQAQEDGGAPAVEADAGVAIVLAASPSFVDENFHGTRVYTSTSHYEVGLMLGQGGLLFADGVAPIPLNGVVLRERNGILSYLLTVLAGQALSSWAIASSAVEVKNVRTSSSTDIRYNADGSRTAVTTTTTTADVRQLKSQEQVDRETEASNRSISGGFVGHTFGDLAIYAEVPALSGGRPAGAGYEFTFGGHGELFELMHLPVVLDVGVHLANVRVKRPNAPGIGGPFLYHSAGGLLGRLHVPVTRFAAVSVEWVLNFLSIGYLLDPEGLLADGSRPLSPLRFTLDVFATDFVFLRGEATFGMLGVSDGRLGVSLTAGVRL
ncbi:MAG: hypothetical protein JNM69_15900 [Archangium sp.]|nr:hypothetical protein [Archangium sp.]